METIVPRRSFPTTSKHFQVPTCLTGSFYCFIFYGLWCTMEIQTLMQLFISLLIPRVLNYSRRFWRKSIGIRYRGEVQCLGRRYVCYGVSAQSVVRYRLGTCVIGGVRWWRQEAHSVHRPGQWLLFLSLVLWILVSQQAEGMGCGSGDEKERHTPIFPCLPRELPPKQQGLSPRSKPCLSSSSPL